MVSIIVLKLLLTFVLAIIFGLERQRAHKPIGFGTYVFVSLGSCALAISAVQHSPENPLPLLGAIITGIGFLGAGALMKNSDKIFGFTSAASIWAFSIIGLLIGISEYLLAVSMYFGIWLVILIDTYLEIRGLGGYQRKLTISVDKSLSIKSVQKMLYIDTSKILTQELKDEILTYTLKLQGSKKYFKKIPEKLLNNKKVISFKIE